MCMIKKLFRLLLHLFPINLRLLVCRLAANKGDGRPHPGESLRRGQQLLVLRDFLIRRRLILDTTAVTRVLFQVTRSREALAAAAAPMCAEVDVAMS